MQYLDFCVTAPLSQVGAIGGVLKKGTLTFLDQRRFNNIAIKLTQVLVLILILVQLVCCC